MPSPFLFRSVICLRAKAVEEVGDALDKITQRQTLDEEAVDKADELQGLARLQTENDAETRKHLPTPPLAWP